MPVELSAELKQRLERFQQQHVLKWWGELADEQRDALQAELNGIDFDLIERLTNDWRSRGDDDDAPAESSVEPPESVADLPRTDADRAERNRAKQIGEELLAAGKVGAVLVAGGQGTRLGFDAPKGMFPIGPVTDRTLFQLFAEQLQARSRPAGATIPYYVMTSAATHAETVEFFEANDFLGLNRDAVFFFQQGATPAVDASTGKLLLAEKGRLALGPDGHGGLLAALRRGGLFDDMARRGIEVLYYHQVDNPATVVCDPVFLGLHRLRESEASTKVVSKVAPEERMGVVVSVGGRTQIIEYSDLSAELARQREPDGRLRIRAGNTAIHAFNREFLERMATEDLLPFHVAHKKVGCVNDSGEFVEPAAENGLKFERFIFDVLPHAQNALVMEVDRAAEFLPVKNADGADSPATSRAGLSRMYADWLRSAGAEVSSDADLALEISPLYAVDRDELKAKLPGGTIVDGPRVFAENGKG